MWNGGLIWHPSMKGMEICLHSTFCPFDLHEPMAWFVYAYRFLTEEIFKKPVIVYNYPKGIKAFYMRLNDDSKTVAAMDILVPKVNLSLHTF